MLNSSLLPSFIRNVFTTQQSSEAFASPTTSTSHVQLSTELDHTREFSAPGMRTKMVGMTRENNSTALLQPTIAETEGSHDGAAVGKAGATTTATVDISIKTYNFAPSPASSNLSSAPTSPNLTSRNNNDDQDSSTLSISSPLSSAASRSPSPPSELDLGLSYPSPLPSHESASSHEGSPTPTLEQAMQRRVRAREQEPEQDQAPPAKRRRTTEPKVRTTEYLDLSQGSLHEDQQLTDRLLKTLHNARKIVVVAGAGISVSAGIPDFRSDTGLFRSLRKEHKLKSSGKDLFDASVYKDADSTAQFHDMVRNMANDTQNCSPTPFHHLLATLADQGRLLRLYTQNIDSLDTQLPPLATQVPLERKGPWPKAVQVHGNLQKMVCIKCRKVSDLVPEIFDGPTPPECENCVEVDRLHTEVAGKRSRGIGWLRPRMVLYNESNPDEEAIGAVMAADLRKRPDALIVVGTTLQIPGMKRLVREMCSVIRGRQEGMTVWLNRDPPPAVKDYEWDLIVKSNCDEIAKRVQMKQWNEMDDIPIYGQDDDQAKARRSPEIVIRSPSKAAAARAQSQTSESSYHFEPMRNLSPKKGNKQLIGIPTPVASPRIAPLQLGQKKAVAAPTATVAAKAGKKAGAKATNTTQAKKAPAKRAAGRKSTTAKPKSKPNGMLTFSISKSAENTQGKVGKKPKGATVKPIESGKGTNVRIIVSTPGQKPQQQPSKATLQEALELLSSPESNGSPTAPRTPSKAMHPVTPSEGRLNGGSRSPTRPPHSPIPENYRSDGEYWGLQENIPKPIDPPADPYRSHSPTDRVHPDLCKVMAKSHSPRMRAHSRSSTLEIDLKTSPEPKHWSSSSTIQLVPEIKIPKIRYDFAHRGAYVGESKEQRNRTVSPISVPGSMQILLN